MSPGLLIVVRACGVGRYCCKKIDRAEQGYCIFCISHIPNTKTG